MGALMDPDQVLAWRQEQAALDRRVVFTNGHFDLLHAGHVRYLQAARRLGDALVIGLNSDVSAGRRKPGRPIVPQEDRAELLAALACVDAVVIYDELTAVHLVEMLRPDIYVKGGDWARPENPPPEAVVAEALGGVVRYLPYVPDHSTSLIIERIRRLPTGTP